MPHASTPPSPHAATSRPPPLRLLFWETTAGCNLACVHCRRLDVSRELMKNDLTTAQGITLIDQVAAIGRPILVFSGGEPLMRPDIFDLATRAKNRGLLTALATNGTMITNKIAQQIAESGFDRVSISLDGADASTHDRFRGLAGSFEQAMNGLTLLHVMGMSTQINCTIARHNQDQIEAILRLAENIGAVAVHYFLLVPVGCGEQIADDQMLNPQEVEDRLNWISRLEATTKLLIKPTCAPHYYRILRQQAAASKTGQQFRPNAEHPSNHLHPQHTDHSNHANHKAALHSITKGCLAGTGVCFVSHEGNVFPCGYLPVSVGNVLQQNLGDLWRDAPIFRAFRNPELLTGKCGRCEYQAICGGCRARAYYEYNDYLAEEPYCTHEPYRSH